MTVRKLEMPYIMLIHTSTSCLQQITEIHFLFVAGYAGTRFLFETGHCVGVALEWRGLE